MTDPDFIECQNCATKPGAPYLCTSCLNNREAISLLLEVLRAAEKIEGPRRPRGVLEVPVPDVVELHRAIRKAKGMQ